MMRRAAKATPTNRRASGPRASREILLDVRVRRATARRQRKHRALRLFLGVTLWLTVAGGTIYGFHAVTQKFFLQNPEYNLRVIEADLDGLMSRDEALLLTGLHPGTNIFQLDLAAAERGLRAIDQVETISIRRDWPDTVRITLTKRHPVAWLAPAGRDFSADTALLLDAAGRTMRPYRIEPEYWRLPVIFAPDPALIQNQDPLATADLRAALDLLAARAQRPDHLLEVHSMDITKGFAITVTDAAKSRLVFSPEDPGEQLDRLQKLLENCRDTGRQLDSVNLIPKKYTPVRFLLVAGPEPALEPAKTRSKAHP